MKIGILSHPLAMNYGGILQAYALQRTLKLNGHDAWIINRRIADPPARRLLATIKHGILKYLGREIIIDDSAIAVFRDTVRPITAPTMSSAALRRQARRMNFDACIVGSDQVWRPRYVKDISDYFFGFLDNTATKRLSYAASFGVDNWEFTPKETQTCKELISAFTAVSVRESSGIDLCRDYLDTTAVRVCDPVFLVETGHWREVADITEAEPRKNQAFFYVFEQSDVSKVVSRELHTINGLNVIDLKPVESRQGMRRVSHLHSVGEWLRAIAQSRLVVTDSFHVCAFCILFGTPFYVIENPTRGNARIDSLLHTFGLDNLKIDISTADRVRNIPDFDTNAVNRTVETERTSGLRFLQKNL